MQDDLKERLRRIVKKPYSAKRGPPPCELQMLDRIEALEAEIERLRGALTQIARIRTDLRGDFSLGSKQSDIARAALASLPKEVG